MSMHGLLAEIPAFACPIINPNEAGPQSIDKPVSGVYGERKIPLTRMLEFSIMRMDLFSEPKQRAAHSGFSLKQGKSREGEPMNKATRKTVLEAIDAHFLQGERIRIFEQEMIRPGPWREKHQRSDELLHVFLGKTAVVEGTPEVLSLSVGQAGGAKNLLEADYNLRTGEVLHLLFTDKTGDLGVDYAENGKRESSSEAWEEKLALQRGDEFLMELCRRGAVRLPSHLHWEHQR